jgi:excinuclease ABC subunit C
MGRCDAPCVEGIGKEGYRAAIDRVVLFLEGKLDIVRAELLAEMKSAAGAQDFERAARLRDQVAQVEHLQSRQVVLSPRFTNQDVVGFVTDRRRTHAYASLIMVRGGRVLGTEHFELAIDPSATDADVVRALVLQRYDDATFIPRELLLPAKLDDAEAVAALLEQRAASLGLAQRTRIRWPRAGAARRLVSMAEENALEFRARKTVELAVDEAGTRVALERLGKALGLKKGPDRVEIYDISNIQGTSAVGSMVVFVQGKPSKADYRRFKIATLKEEPNDVGMMKEVLRRRLSRLIAGDPRWPRPDLIIVDGGKPQLGAALTVLAELDLDVPLAGLAKREEELFVSGGATSIMLPRGTAALHLVQRMRDEAHRFAITFHRQLRSARTRRSLLDEVVGIGPKRKKLLLERYGSVEALADAGETELGKLIGARAAAALLAQLR